MKTQDEIIDELQSKIDLKRKQVKRKKKSLKTNLIYETPERNYNMNVCGTERLAEIIAHATGLIEGYKKLGVPASDDSVMLYKDYISDAQEIHAQRNAVVAVQELTEMEGVLKSLVSEERKQRDKLAEISAKLDDK